MVKVFGPAENINIERRDWAIEQLFRGCFSPLRLAVEVREKPARIVMQSRPAPALDLPGIEAIA